MREALFSYSDVVMSFALSIVFSATCVVFCLCMGIFWGGRKWANGSASDSCLTCLASQWDGFHCPCNKAILAVGVLVQFNIFSHFQSEIKGAWQWEPLRTQGRVMVCASIIFQTHKGFLVLGLSGSPNQSSHYFFQPRRVQCTDVDTCGKTAAQLQIFSADLNKIFIRHISRLKADSKW